MRIRRPAIEARTPPVPSIDERIGAEAAAGPSWSADGSWRSSWESPRNWIFGEGDQVATVASLVGRPREHGYLVPVDVVLEREPRNAHDQNAVRASVDGRMIGYLARTIAAQVSPTMVYVWLDRGEEKLHVHDNGGRVAWPPSTDEGRS
jgi:hypothetical protein